MEHIDVARKALDSISGASFSCNMYASEGGCCGDSWTGSEDLYLKKEEIFYLLSGGNGESELFRGMPMTPVDVESTIDNMACEAAFPCGPLDDESEWECGGECDSLDNYLNAWNTLLDQISDGVVTEDNLSLWLNYFEEREYNDGYTTIEEWVKEQSEE